MIRRARGAKPLDFSPSDRGFQLFQKPLASRLPGVENPAFGHEGIGGDALKPGGELVVGDYSAKPGAGTSVVKTLHRSDEALVRSEIEAAGFKMIDHGDFLRVPGDARDAHSHSSAQPVDIYMMKFRKPG